MSSTRYLSVDVECVSTGKTHNDRGVCSVAVVDSNEETLLHAIVKPDKPVVSYLTPISGNKQYNTREYSAHQGIVEKTTL